MMTAAAAVALIYSKGVFWLYYLFDIDTVGFVGLELLDHYYKQVPQHPQYVHANWSYYLQCSMVL